MKKSPQQKKPQEVEAENVEQDALHEAQQEVEQYKNLYLRALADYKNLENRMSHERQRMQIAVKKQMIYDLLPVLDNLEQAEVFTQDPGLQMISSSFKKAITEMGLQEVALLGTEYDPEYAEAIAVVPGKNDNIVEEVLQKAYVLDGHVIRHGKVKVSKKS